jgi:hypothetical protein
LYLFVNNNINFIEAKHTIQIANQIHIEMVQLDTKKDKARTGSVSRKKKNKKKI